MTTTITGATGIDNIKAATGAVLQVVQATYNTNFSTTSASFVDTGLTATITPSSTSSKILVIINQVGFINGSANIKMNIVRGSSEIISIYTQDQTSTQTFTANVNNFLDSPSTTSATTYKTQGLTSAGTLYFQWTGDGYSTITLMEIAG